jgi:hypothetical protein
MALPSFVAKLFGQKFLLTASSLLAVFLLMYLDKPVDKLEIIIPAILLFYNTANVAQKHVLKDKRNGSIDNVT